jgi:FHS family Na+ dependent glucose MFS transporter 1
LLLSVIGPALSQLRRQAGVSVGSISVLFAVQSLGYLLGSIVGGRLYDRGLGHRVMAGALVICGISVAFVPALDTVIGLACAFWLVGVGAAAIDVGGNTLLVWSRGDTVGPMMNALHFSFGAGALLSPVLVDRSIAWGGDLRIACWTAAAVSVVIAVLLLARTAPSRLPVVAPRQPGARRPRPPALLVAFAVFFLLYVGVELGFAGWIFTYGEELGIGGARGPAVLTALFWIGFTGGRLLSVVFARRIQPATMLYGSCVLAVVAVGALVVADGAPAAVWIGTFMFGLGVAPQFPTMISFAESHLRLTGSDTSWFVGAAGLGGLVLPWAIGQVIDDTDVSAMPLIVFAVAAATLAWFMVLRRIAARYLARTGGVRAER